MNWATAEPRPGAAPTAPAGPYLFPSHPNPALSAPAFPCARSRKAPRPPRPGAPRIYGDGGEESPFPSGTEAERPRLPASSRGAWMDAADPGLARGAPGGAWAGGMPGRGTCPCRSAAWEPARRALASGMGAAAAAAESDGNKLQEGKLRLDIGRKCFTVRVVRPLEQGGCECPRPWWFVKPGWIRP